MRVGRRFWEVNREGKRKERKGKEKKERKKVGKKRKKKGRKRKEKGRGMMAGDGRRSPAAAGVGGSWPEKAAKALSPSHQMGCKYSSF